MLKASTEPDIAKVLFELYLYRRSLMIYEDVYKWNGMKSELSNCLDSKPALHQANNSNYSLLSKSVGFEVSFNKA